MIPDDHHKRHELRQRMTPVFGVPTEPAPFHPSLQPIDDPWTRPALARPIPVSRPWWRRLVDALLDCFR